MTKTLYLHVGMPKCASTTIQGVLRSEAETFAAQGKFYGHPPEDGTEGQGNVSVLLADIRSNRTARVRRKLSFFLDRDTDVILSSEMFIGLARTQLADELIARIREDGFTPKLICYLRRQDHWIESDYKQHIKGGSDWVEGIDTLLRRRTQTRVLDYHWMLENWARSVGRENITVVPLERGQGDGYPLERFLEFLDMDPALAGSLSHARQNVSPPVGLVEPLRHLKQALLAGGMKPLQAAKPLRRFLKLAPERLEVPARQFLLPLKRREALLARYAESNAALSEAYLGGVPAFAAELEEDAASEALLAEEAAGVLAAWIAADPEQFAPPGDAPEDDAEPDLPDPSGPPDAPPRWRLWRRR